MLLFWTIGLLLLATVRGEERCYPRLGCFSNDRPWAGTIHRPLKLFPSSPEEINTRFLLYTNENQSNYELISAVNPDSIKASNFKPDRKTRLIVHGFLDTGEMSWLKDMCTNMFQVEQVNCICVDWKGGSRTSYSKAVQNIRVVGAEMAYFVQGLSTELGYSPQDVHLIGHSLGAHAAAEAGRRLVGFVGRITGLDPAGPSFQDTPELVRLDPSDAMFVDVIHTDTSFTITSLGAGINQKVGHMDFFPNGGKQMPGCEKRIVSTIRDLDELLEASSYSALGDIISCSHLQTYRYYSSSILNPDGFLSYPCPSYEEFQKNNCFPCPAKGCAKMGHYADQFIGKTDAVEQTFFLNTGATGDFTSWRYRVSVTLSTETELNGSISVALYGKNGNTRQHEIFNGVLKPDARHLNDIDVDLDYGEMKEVKFLWSNNRIDLSQPKLGASQITVQSGKDGAEQRFCGSDAVPAGVLQSLPPC